MVANRGGKVCIDGQLFLGAGAEPLSHPRLLMTGHQDADRPSGISVRLDSKEEIDTEVGARMRLKEDSRQITDVKG